MIREFRQRYNLAFTQARYNALIADLNSAMRFPTDFHLCETPLFISQALMQHLLVASEALFRATHTPEYLARCAEAIPPSMVVPNETPHTDFLQLDFSITQTETGEYLPQLIELQGFPSLYGFQWLLDKKIRQYFEIDPSLRFYVAPHDEQSYLRLLREVVVGDHDPQQVALVEIYPEKQKTRIDFACTEHLLGVQTVCLTKIIKRGRKLFYRHPESGREIAIERIYSRIIFDDLVGQGIQSDYALTDEVDVTWAGHPNWFFKISKYSLPLLSALNSPYVPQSYFLSQLSVYPPHLSDYVLKPLFSYSGAGVDLDPSVEKLDAIPSDQRGQFVLQRKVDYAPVVETPDGFSKAEVRILMLWHPQKPAPEAVCTLVRMSKGRMMGTRFNLDRTWVGSTLAYHVPIAD
ncbi:MAG: hypothetical protein OHK0023_22550 [Anaerolineae bacterium]